ncbi:MAG: periplasmic heavy metal sensor [Pseudomonadota bacterium]
MSNSRALLIGLAVSLGVNLLLIGAFAGTALRPPPKPGQQTRIDAPRGSPERTMARALLAAAPETDRQAIRGELRQSWRETAQIRQRVDQARREVAEALQSDPYDEDRTISAFIALSEAEAELKTTLQTNLAKRLGDLSPELRQRMVESMARRDDRRERFRQRPRNR